MLKNTCHYPRDLIKHWKVNAKMNVLIGQDNWDRGSWKSGCTWGVHSVIETLQPFLPCLWKPGEVLLQFCERNSLSKANYWCTVCRLKEFLCWHCTLWSAFLQHCCAIKFLFLRISESAPACWVVVRKMDHFFSVIIILNVNLNILFIYIDFEEIIFLDFHLLYLL